MYNKVWIKTPLAAEPPKMITVTRKDILLLRAVQTNKKIIQQKIRRKLPLKLYFLLKVYNFLSVFNNLLITNKKNVFICIVNVIIKLYLSK